ncbi:MAG: AlpA family transcriptional regulator [Alphaproteobacteria bacterium]|nr:AlpA family transcriptional regulator [Alphaproteobacteria bacterium]
MRIIDLLEVRKRVVYSKNHIYRLMRAGEFPRQVRLGPARVGWVEDEIDEWIEQRVAARTCPFKAA